MGFSLRKPAEKLAHEDVSPSADVPVATHVPLEDLQKSRWERSWPTIACGAGLFSDGYLNGFVNPRSSLVKIHTNTAGR